MLKLLFALPLITLALFTNTLIPSMTTVTFQPDTTLTQVIELLDANNTWPHHGNFVTTNGSGFLYKQNSSMSISEREHAVWVAQRTFAHLNQEPVSQTITDCIASKACPVTIHKLTLLNPPIEILNAPIIATTESHRAIHPFFQENLKLGHP